MGSIRLEQIDIPEPCPASWRSMSDTTPSSRFCQACQKHVHDLSAMSRDAAEELVCRSAGSLCVRFYRQADGTVRTLDYQTQAEGRRWTWKFWTVVGVCSALVAGVVNAFFFGDRVTRPTGVIAGAICPLPTVTTTAPSQSGSATAPHAGFGASSDDPDRSSNDAPTPPRE